jgi:hypothetical protein
MKNSGISLSLKKTEKKLFGTGCERQYATAGVNQLFLRRQTPFFCQLKEKVFEKGP